MPRETHIFGDVSKIRILLVTGSRMLVTFALQGLHQSRSQSPRYPRPAVGNEGLWDKAFTGKQESCDRSNCAGVRHSHIRLYQMESLFYEAIEFSMEKLGIKVLMKEQYDALLKSYMCRKKVCWWHCRQFSENRLSDFTFDVRLHLKRLWGKILLLS